MADRFDEAPPLPREPTALSVPDAVSNPSETTPDPSAAPGISETLPPPPKFPSLTDVDIAAAKAAAEEQGMPQHSPGETSLVSTATTTDTPPMAESQPPQSDVQVVESVETLPESATSRPTSTIHEDIKAAIESAAVTPGTGQQKVMEIGQRLWTPSDQKELEDLLDEGKELYLPPDVERDDLIGPAPHVAPYFYAPRPVPASEEGAGVDTSPDTRSMADRIAIWNEIVTEDSDHTRGLAAGAAAGATAGVAAAGAIPAEEVGDVQEVKPIGGDTEAVEAAGKTTTEKAVPTVRSNADVSKSIFGGKFLTVPVTSPKKHNGVTTLIGETADNEPVKTTEVMLRSDASASVNIKKDYGLKGGHTIGCNYAVFLKGDQTLATCGEDGKVCIWDMSDHSVSKEFVPYEGEAVIMVYPMTDDDEDGKSHTIMTLSKSRLMRIWTVDDKQAVMLRSTQIQPSEKDLYMSVPVISKELKIRAAAAAAAAAVTTTEAPEAAAEAGPAVAETAPASAPPAAETAAAGAAAPGAEAAGKEEEKERKKLSFRKVLSFGRHSSRKAVAS